jgi:hypothetical protein
MLEVDILFNIFHGFYSSRLKYWELGGANGLVLWKNI